MYAISIFDVAGDKAVECCIIKRGGVDVYGWCVARNLVDPKRFQHVHINVYIYEVEDVDFLNVNIYVSNDMAGIVIDWVVEW